ncbi:MAG: WD40/YVTN/BNR-like repeat-containing protein [Draconibacterium sp.]
MIKASLFLCVAFLLLQGCMCKKVSPDIRIQVLNTETNASLRGLFVVNENVVWASGSAGTVLLSKNGGESWENVSVPGAEANDFRSIHAWDESRVMVFGIAGPDFGFLTEDGGKSWNVAYSDTAKGLFFNSLKFADTVNGLAVSDPVDGKFFVLRTEDGGRNWERVTSLPAVEKGEANFAASNTCIEYLPSGKAWIASGGMAARVFYSNNFGKTWDVVKTPMIRGSASSGIFSIAFQNEKEGVIIGGIYDQPEVNTNIAAYSIDGGKTWLPAENMPGEYRSCVQPVNFDGEPVFFAIGKTGCDFSADGGRNWKPVSADGYYTFRAVPGESTGFAAGAEGRIARVSFKHQ